MAHRTLALPLHRAAALGEPVLVQGPRGAGKTALLRREFPGHRYLTLEDSSDRHKARQDPAAFLARLRGPTIIDDAHRAPELSNLEGPVILASSRRLKLPIATFELHPPTRAEREQRPPLPLDMLGRFVPKPIPARPTDAPISQFPERDLRDLIQLHDLDRFETFLESARKRSAQVLDQQAIATECGLSHSTVTRWLAALDACFLILKLLPTDLDFNRRLVKSPKLHFLDQGPFESQVVAELYRNAVHTGEVPDLRYFRDSNGFEIPLIIQTETMPVGIVEVPTPNEVTKLRRWMDLAGVRQAALIAKQAGSARSGGIARYSVDQL